MTTRKEEIAAILERLKETKTRSFTLQSYDGKVNKEYHSRKLEVDKLCVLESDAIRVFFLEYGFDEYDIHTESPILEQILEYCKVRAEIKVKYFMHHDDENLLQAKLNDFDSEFLEKISTSKRLLIDFLHAACRLRIKSLVDQTSAAIVNMVGETDTPEILKMFALKENITVKQIDDEFKASGWAFE